MVDSSRPAHESAKVVLCNNEDEVWPPSPEDAPVQLSEPPLTEQLETLLTFQYTRVVPPLETSEGRTWRWPVVSVSASGLNVGGGGKMQAPVPH